MNVPHLTLIEVREVNSMLVSGTGQLQIGLHELGVHSFPGDIPCFMATVNDHPNILEQVWKK